MRIGVGLLFLTVAVGCVESAKKESARPPASTARSTSATPAVASSVASAPTTAVVDAAPQCPPGIDGGTIDFFVKRETVPAQPPDREKPGPGIVLTAPSLNLKIELVTMPVPMSCDTSIRTAAQTMYVSCTFSPTTFTFEIRREPDRIRFIAKSSGEVAPGPTPIAPSEFHPPVSLPCGTRLVFHHFEWRDPKWSAFGSACQTRCFDKVRTCMRPCMTDLTDEHGDLTDAGETCASKCREAGVTCIGKCPPN